MLRVIFDTNVYGLLLNERDAVWLEQKISDDKEFLVYGYRMVRKELRDIPKISKLSKRNRILLLSLYDRITGNHFFEHSIKLTGLAKKYYDYYRSLGGIYNWNTSIQVDFMIVACASFHGLDIIYSADDRTLLSKTSLKAYKHVNLKENLRTPDFMKYQDLLRKLRNLL